MRTNFVGDARGLKAKCSRRGCEEVRQEENPCSTEVCKEWNNRDDTNSECTGY
jgi:hypothetical protein